MLSFKNKKQLRFVITLGVGKFGSSDNNIVTLQGFRATADIDKAGGMMMSTLRARIYGVSQSDMNSITTLQWKPALRIKNTVEVFAIDGESETLVYAGDIVNAWGDYQNMPDVFLHIQAQSAYYSGLQPVQPLSYKKGVDVSIVMEKIAEAMGLKFENNNVHVALCDQYVCNTAKEQALELARAGNFSLYIDDKILSITNKYAPREGLIPEISAETGMVGYPTFDAIGITCRTLFNPGVMFGGRIKVKTDIEQAAGEWIVVSVGHRLESERPGGAWFSIIRGNQNGLAILSR